MARGRSSLIVGMMSVITLIFITLSSTSQPSNGFPLTSILAKKFLAAAKLGVLDDAEVESVTVKRVEGDRESPEDGDDGGDPDTGGEGEEPVDIEEEVDVEVVEGLENAENILPQDVEDAGADGGEDAGADGGEDADADGGEDADADGEDADADGGGDDGGDLPFDFDFEGGGDDEAPGRRLEPDQAALNRYRRMCKDDCHDHYEGHELRQCLRYAKNCSAGGGGSCSKLNEDAYRAFCMTKCGYGLMPTPPPAHCQDACFAYGRTRCIDLACKDIVPDCHLDTTKCAEVSGYCFP